MSYNPYHWCLVSECKNTSIKTPGKLWIQVPTDSKMRDTWLKMARRDPKSLSRKTKYYLCEDHFDLQQDMENYPEYKIMGSVKRIRMKPNCVPSRFDCQPMRKLTQKEKRARAAFLKRQRKSIIKEIEEAQNQSQISSQDFPPLENKCEDVKAMQTVPPQLENDMENYIQYRVMGSVKKIKMKPDCLPSKFECRNLGNLENVQTTNVDTAEYLEIIMSPDESGEEGRMSPVERITSHRKETRRPTQLQKSHEGSATPSEDSEVEIQRLAKKLTAALTTISVLTKKNGDLTKKNQELSKKVAALEQKNKLMGRQQAVLQKLNEGLARRSLLVEQRSERLRARIAAHGITDAVTDDDEGEEEEPRPPPDTHPHPESDTEETETADEDWAMSQDSSPEQTGTTSKIRPKPLNDLLRVSHQKNVKIVNVLAKSKRRMPRKATNTTLGKRSRHNSVTSKNSRIETCVEPLVETSCVGSEQADPLSLMTPDEIKIEDDIKIEEPDIEEYIAATKQI